MPTPRAKAPIERPCPYCESRKTIRYGRRQNRAGSVQLYKCTHCRRRFRDRATHNTTYPQKAIIETLSLYNRGYPLEEAAKRAGKRHRLQISRQTAASWKARYASFFPYFKIRHAVVAKFSPHDVITTTRLHHGQVYLYEYQRGKLQNLQATSTMSAAFLCLSAYLEAAPTETPHDLFRTQRARASQTAEKFSLDEVAITERRNVAVEMAQFVIPTVARNYKRHETLQDFMLVNDTATVAVEVPVFLTHTDIAHYTRKLGFRIPIALSAGEAVAGHIDILQIRGGKIHILDYKPGAKKDKPIEQLMVYALALARRTGLRLMDFTCAWFDDEHYYEFEPLRVVLKLQKRRT